MNAKYKAGLSSMEKLESGWGDGTHELEIPSASDPLFFDCLMAAKHIYDGTVKES